MYADFVVMPIWSVAADFFPKLKDRVEAMRTNRATWEERKAALLAEQAPDAGEEGKKAGGGEDAPAKTAAPTSDAPAPTPTAGKITDEIKEE